MTHNEHVSAGEGTRDPYVPNGRPHVQGRDGALPVNAALCERFVTIFQHLLDAVLIVDGESGRIIEVNPAVTRILGYERGELLDQHFSCLFWADDKHTPEELWERVHVYGSVLESQDFRRTNGTACPMSLVASIIPWGTGRAVLLTLRDITERLAAEERLREYQEKLRGLAQELTETEERQRRGYARELHDRVGQSLAIAKIRLGLLRDMLPPEHARHIKEVTDLLDPMIQDVRSLTFEMCPPVLDELGLAPALDWLADHFSRTYGLNVALNGTPNGMLAKAPLDPHISSFIFQSVRELLVNVLKHAQASHVKVHLRRRENGDIEVVVQDDGKGIDPAWTERQSSATGGFGLFSIRERLRRYGGNLELRPGQGGGTKARLVVPDSSSGR